LRKCWWFPSDFLSSRGVPTLTAIVCLQCLLHPTRSSANATKPKENAVNDQLHSWNQTILLSRYMYPQDSTVGMPKLKRLCTVVGTSL
jgi:hypothetical protein